MIIRKISPLPPPPPPVEYHLTLSELELIAIMAALGVTSLSDLRRTYYNSTGSSTASSCAVKLCDEGELEDAVGKLFLQIVKEFE